MSRSRRILVVTLRYPPHVVGGYEQITHDCVRGLIERGHRVEVLCGKSAALEGQAGITARLEPPIDGAQNLFERSHRGTNRERFALHFHSKANAEATREAIERFDPELVLYHNLGLVSLAPLHEAARAGLPRLGVICDMWPANHWIRDWTQQGGKRLKLWALRRLWSWWRGRVGFGRMLVPSQSLRAELVDAGFEPEVLDLVPLALPPEVEARAFEAPLPRRAPDQPLVVACTSSHWEGKGVHVLLDAAALAVERGANLELVLVGDGDPGYRARLSAQASREVLSGRVRFTGRLQQRDLGRVFEHAHVFSFPSIWPEPFGRGSLEAMAFGLALVASAAGGIPEQFVDGESGLAVPPDDAEALAAALMALERDEARRLSLAEAGRARVDAHFRSAGFFDTLEARIEAELAGSAA